MMLHLHEVGPGERPVVFVHGLLGQGRNFHTIAKTLVTRDPSLRIAMVDLPNHGRSPWTGSIDYVDMAAEVADTVRQWSPDRPVALVGHSMGGRTVMQLALRHPELVERLVVSDISPVEGDRSSSVFERFVYSLQRLDLATLESRSQADDLLKPLVPNDTIRGFLLQNLRRDTSGWHWQANLDLLERDLDLVASWPDPEGHSYPGPVLWVRGALSGYVQDAHRPAMEALFPNTRLVTIKNAGHWVHSEQPQVFTEVLVNFLSQAPSS